MSSMSLRCQSKPDSNAGWVPQAGPNNPVCSRCYTPLLPATSQTPRAVFFPPACQFRASRGAWPASMGAAGLVRCQPPLCPSSAFPAPQSAPLPTPHLLQLRAGRGGGPLEAQHAKAAHHEVGQHAGHAAGQRGEGSRLSGVGPVPCRGGTPRRLHLPGHVRRLPRCTSCSQRSDPALASGPFRLAVTAWFAPPPPPPAHEVLHGK